MQEDHPGETNVQNRYIISKTHGYQCTCAEHLVLYHIKCYIYVENVCKSYNHFVSDELEQEMNKSGLRIRWPMKLRSLPRLPGPDELKRKHYHFGFPKATWTQKQRSSRYMTNINRSFCFSIFIISVRNHFCSKPMCLLWHVYPAMAWRKYMSSIRPTRRCHPEKVVG